MPLHQEHHPARAFAAPPGEIFWRVAPFAVYMVFTAIVEVSALLGLSFSGAWAGTLYPVRAVCVAVALAVCLPKCPELRLADMTGRGILFASMVGMAVFAAWLALDVPWGRVGTPVAFPHRAWGDAARPLLLAIRFIGAAVLVPLAEELFWRSFLMRHIQGGDFRRVPLSRFHPLSFLAVTVLFGLEHHLVVAGMLAGAAYNMVALRTGSLGCCVLAHAVTNGLLGLWVLYAGAWTLW